MITIRRKDRMSTGIVSVCDENGEELDRLVLIFVSGKEGIHVSGSLDHGMVERQPVRWMVKGFDSMPSAEQLSEDGSEWYCPKCGRCWGLSGINVKEAKERRLHLCSNSECHFQAGKGETRVIPVGYETLPVSVGEEVQSS